jgi:hypothetical protein
MFSIQTSDDYNFVAGKIISGEQVLLGLGPAELLAVCFDPSGQVLRIERRDVVVETTLPQIEQEKIFWSALESWKTFLGFSPSDIKVADFLIPEVDVGIARIPEFWWSFVSDPESITDEELRRQRLREIEDWLRLGNFVLRWCGKEYWMNSDGEVTDT